MDKRKVQDFTSDYITSFNNMLNPGLKDILKNLRPTEFELGTGERVKLEIENIMINKPKCSVDPHRDLYPWECRRMKLTYEGKVLLTIGITVDGTKKMSITQSIGSIPIMIRSQLCHLFNATEEEFIKHNEEDDELGGYFIVKGNQCMLRYLVQSRQNFPMVSMKLFQSIGSDRTGHQIYIRCVRDDDTSSEMKIFWRTNTCPDLQLQIGKKYFQIPLPIILKSLQNKSPLEIFEDVPKTPENISLIENLTMMFYKFSGTDNQFISDVSCIEVLGSKFRDYLKIPPWVPNYNAGKQFIDDFIAINLPDYKDKYNLLIVMLLKLHEFVNNGCCAESMDTLNFQEILTPGALYKQVLRLSLSHYMNNIDRYIMNTLNKTANKSLEDVIKNTFREGKGILNPLHYLLSTGSLGRFIVPGVKQNNGLRVLTDNINFYRLAANFRAFHRGAFFTTMKSSAIRRLLPESWGFVCPVHTPDGTPCGLLNHLSINTKIQSEMCSANEVKNLETMLNRYTVKFEAVKMMTDIDKYIVVMLDGRLIGFVSDKNAQTLADFIRFKKVIPDKNMLIPSVTEIVVKNISKTAAQFPGLYVFTTPGRFLRPVYNLMFGKPMIEWISSFEQTYLDIACRGGTLQKGGDMDNAATHCELSQESMYSFTASFTPYQNYNPSPRNLYQCQMSKQSMGFTYYTTRFRADNKLYCFLTPQTPLTKSKTYDEYEMSNRCLGYNPIVAVCSYTGYDMEDAMVINSNSFERGMGRCCIYKHYVIDLSSEKGKSTDNELGCGSTVVEGLDSDGLPYIGRQLYPGLKKSAIYAYVCRQTQKIQVVYYKESEPGFVVNVSLNGSRKSATIAIKLERNTDIGDKFSSRHGQKGVNSLRLSTVDLPYSEDGIAPDQLFNPHSFPSRMTMGMEIEILAGKLAALSGKTIDCTAFQTTDIVSDYISKLKSNYYDGFGVERLCNGYRGNLIKSEVSMGVIYYQRLRHMVGDKFQVRTVGKIDNITRQPVKGRKVGGGIRLGEMERDGLLSHGAVFCLQDRIIESNSDKISIFYCPNCQSFMHSYFNQVEKSVSWLSNSDNAKSNNSWRCKLCENSETNSSKELLKVRIPAVTRHFFHELVTMNIQVRLTVASVENTTEDINY